MDALLSMQGVLAGAAAYAGTKAGQLDGVDEYFTAASPGLGASGWSWSCWVRSASGTGYIATQYRNSSNYWRLSINASGYIVANWNVAGTLLTSTAAVDYTDDAWHHVLAVFSDPGDRQIDLYVDGVLKDSDTVAGNGTAFTDAVYVGSQSGTGSFLACRVCDLAAWAAVLDSTDAAELYNGGVRGDPEALCGRTASRLWAFAATDDMTGTTGGILDLKGGGNLTPFNTESGDLVAGP